MTERLLYQYHNRRNALKWIWQGSIDKHFFKPYGKEYHYVTKKIDGKRILNKEEAHKEISRLINSNNPFWVARYGHTEMRYINAVLYNRYVNGKITPENAAPQAALDQLCNNAGFFPNDKEMGEKYVDEVIRVSTHIDIHAVWDLWMEEYMGCVYEKKTKYMHWGDFAPYYLRQEEEIKPWTHALKGKKVLVVNPFVDSIEKQYMQNRERIFRNIFDADDILPEFDLITLKSVQTSGGNKDDRFADWFEALEFMKEQVNIIDFDIALIGCGAYGFLLADYVKRLGKGAIQSCGCTQMLFGVLGKRWMDDKILMSEVVNESWISPSLEERPGGYSNVEDVCYW